MPNIIHSLDAASLTLLSENLFDKNMTNFYSVHDCFAVTCNHVSLLIDLLKFAYCIIYTNKNYLIEFEDNFLNHILKIYGSNCYDPITRIIKIKDLKIKLVFPDVKTIIGKNTISTLDSSYLLH